MDRFLAHLHLDREKPTLDYLHRIVREHQFRVPFETLTKLIDYEPGLRRGDFLPPMTEYVERIVMRGAGGLCWTLARGLHVLLNALGFDAASEASLDRGSVSLSVTDLCDFWAGLAPAESGSEAPGMVEEDRPLAQVLIGEGRGMCKVGFEQSSAFAGDMGGAGLPVCVP